MQLDRVRPASARRRLGGARSAACAEPSGSISDLGHARVDRRRRPRAAEPRDRWRSTRLARLGRCHRGRERRAPRSSPPRVAANTMIAITRDRRDRRESRGIGQGLESLAAATATGSGRIASRSRRRAAATSTRVLARRRSSRRRRRGVALRSSRTWRLNAHARTRSSSDRAGRPRRLVERGLEHVGARAALARDLLQQLLARGDVRLERRLHVLRDRVVLAAVAVLAQHLLEVGGHLLRGRGSAASGSRSSARITIASKSGGTSPLIFDGGGIADLEHLAHRVVVVAALEQPPQRQRLPQHAAERPDVAAPIAGAALAASRAPCS